MHRHVSGTGMLRALVGGTCVIGQGRLPVSIPSKN